MRYPPPGGPHEQAQIRKIIEQSAQLSESRRHNDRCRSRLCRPAGRRARPVQPGPHAAAFQSSNHQCHAHAQPGQDRIQSRHLQPGRPGRSREAQQRSHRRPHHRTRSRPRRQLHRHVFDLRRPRALERAIRRQGHEAPPQRSLPRDQNQRAHPRRFHAHDRKVAPTCCRPITSTSGNCTTSAP